MVVRYNKMLNELMVAIFVRVHRSGHRSRDELPSPPGFLAKRAVDVDVRRR